MITLIQYAVVWSKGVDSVHYSKHAAKKRAAELEDYLLSGGYSYPCVRVELVAK